MGGYALPALHVNPPAPQQNPMEQYGQLLQLKNEMQNAPLRAQLMQEQAQSIQLENQAHQRANDSANALQKAYVESEGDLTKTLPLAAKYGAAPDALIKLKQAAIEQQSSNLKLLQEKGSRAIQEADLYQGAHDAVAQQPADQKPAAYLQQLQGLQQAGIDVSNLPPQYPGDEAFKVFGIALKGHKQQLEDLTKQAELDKTQAQTGEATAKGNEAAVNAQLAPQKVANQMANDTAMRRQGQQRISIDQARLNFERQRSGIESGGDASTLSQAIAQGHITPDRMGYLLSRNPGLMEGVLKVDPSFDSSKAQAYPAVYKDFTSGKTSVALNAGATALGHLKELADMNTAASHIPGTPDYNAYQNKADTVSSELAKFYGDATIPAIASIKKTLTATLPGNRQAAIKTQAQSMGDKLDSFQQQWENAAPSKAYQAPMPGISTRAQSARKELAGGDSQSTGGAQAAPAMPPEGTVKTNSHGDKIMVQGGKWQLQP